MDTVDNREADAVSAICLMAALADMEKTETEQQKLKQVFADLGIEGEASVAIIPLQMKLVHGVGEKYGYSLDRGQSSEHLTVGRDEHDRRKGSPGLRMRKRIPAEAPEREIVAMAFTLTPCPSCSAGR